MLEPYRFGEPGGTPQRELFQLVLQTRTLLEDLVREPEYLNIFYPGAQELMTNAWPSVSIRFEPYAEAVNAAPFAVLEEHGLTGDELRFKLAAINLLGGRFFDLFPDAHFSLRRTLVSKLLEIIDKVLKSLIAAVPGGGAITEFKDVCESLISDEEP